MYNVKIGLVQGRNFDGKSWSWHDSGLCQGMSFLFRKRIKILPGVWFNLSKDGLSTSFGGKFLPALGLVLIVVAIALGFLVK
jgi:hypothetical protein